MSRYSEATQLALERAADKLDGQLDSETIRRLREMIAEACLGDEAHLEQLLGPRQETDGD